MQNLILRPATLADLAEVHAGQARAITHACAPFYEAGTLRRFVTAGGLIAASVLDAGAYRVAVRDGRIVAGTGWSDTAPRLPGVAPGAEAWLRGVFAVPEEAGRGTGRRLVDAVLAELQETGGCRVDLLATLNAVPFYRRLGWCSVRAVSLPMPPMPDMATVWMTHSEARRTECAA